MIKPRLTAIAIAVLFTSTSVNANLMPGGPAEAWTNAQIQFETQSVSQTMNQFGESLMYSLKENFKNLMDAIKVATKQEALNASNESDNIRESSKQLVGAMKVQRQTAQIAKAQLDYGLATGQGYDACGTVLKNKTLDRAYSDLKHQATVTVVAQKAISGNLVKSVGDWEAERVANHRDKFCSKTEADAGLCSVSKLPSGDTNSALFFQPADKDSLHAQARKAYISNVLGAPDAAIDPDSGKTAAAQDFMFEQNHRSALLSIPAYSLAMIDAANTRVPTSGNKSPNEMLINRVNQYFGGGEAIQWAGSLARQTPRGLLLETAKIEGLSNWIRHKKTEQNDRIIANLAALVISAGDVPAANGTSLNGEATRKAKEAASLARSNSINSGIK